MDVFSLIALIANILFLGVNLWLLVRHRREDRAAGDILAREDRIERVGPSDPGLRYPRADCLRREGASYK
jgi:hypothetical protein